MKIYESVIADDENPHQISINFSLYDILHDHMNGEMREKLIESLSCADDVINHVCEQLIDGYTYNGFSGKWCSDLNTPLQLAKKKIAENSDHSIKKTIEGLENKISSLESDVKYWRDEATRRIF